MLQERINNKDKTMNIWMVYETGSPPQHIGSTSRDSSLESILNGAKELGWSAKFAARNNDSKTYLFAGKVKFQAWQERNGLFQESYAA